MKVRRGLSSYLPDLTDDEIMDQIQACREAHPDAYITFKAFVSTRHRQRVMMDVIVNRPDEETEFTIERETRDRRGQGYTIKPTANSAA